jgi:hypothetical protein
VCAHRAAASAARADGASRACAVFHDDRLAERGSKPPRLRTIFQPLAKGNDHGDRPVGVGLSEAGAATAATPAASIAVVAARKAGSSFMVFFPSAS